MNLPKITILEDVKSRSIDTKNGPKTLHEQKAELETESMRIGVTVGLDGPRMGYPVGAQLDWDVVADLVPGKYGIELSRRMTLRQPNAKPAVKAA